MIFDWCFKCDTKHDLDEPCEGIMNTITTNTEATAQLYRSMVYCQDMAYMLALKAAHERSTTKVLLQYGR